MKIRKIPKIPIDKYRMRQSPPQRPRSEVQIKRLDDIHIMMSQICPEVIIRRRRPMIPVKPITYNIQTLTHHIIYSISPPASSFYIKLMIRTTNANIVVAIFRLSANHYPIPNISLLNLSKHRTYFSKEVSVSDVTPCIINDDCLHCCPSVRQQVTVFA